MDDGSPASPRRRRIYAEYAIKQGAVCAGLIEPIGPDNTGSIRRAYQADGMAWANAEPGGPERRCTSGSGRGIRAAETWWREAGS